MPNLHHGMHAQEGVIYHISEQGTRTKECNLSSSTEIAIMYCKACKKKKKKKEKRKKLFKSASGQ